MSTENKPMTPQERIKADAEAHAKIVEERLKGRNVEYGRMVSQVHGYISGYIAGATAVHERAQLLVKTLKQVEYHLLLAKNKPNSTDYKGLVEHLSKAVTEAIEQWKGKEVEPTPHQPEPQPDLGTCVECGTRKAVSDYNSHQYYVCDPCNNRLNREFDKEYN